LMNHGHYNKIVICCNLGLLNNIVSAFRELISLANQGYSKLLFYYSGHGSSMVDKSGDEKDGQDECLVPSDFRTGGFVIDDELNACLKNLKSNLTCQIILITDACHSGTIFDLPFTYSSQNTSGTVNSKNNSTLASVSPTTNIIQISGCMDNQTSASAYAMDRAKIWQGALSFSLQRYLSEMSYKPSNLFDLIVKVRQRLKSLNFSQIPQVSQNNNGSLNNVTITF